MDVLLKKLHHRFKKTENKIDFLIDDDSTTLKKTLNKLLIIANFI